MICKAAIAVAVAVAVAVAAASLLAACQSAPGGGYVSAEPPAPQLPATPTPMPRYSDALAGLYTIPASRFPSDIAINYYAPGGGGDKPGRAVLMMALVPGANHKKLRDYLARANAEFSASSERAQHDLELKPVMKQAIDIVKQRYPWIELADDVATAQKAEASLTLVLDVRARLATKAGDATAVQIEVVAFGDQEKPIAHFVSEGRAIASGLEGYNFMAAARDALAGLAQKSTTYFN